MAYDDYDEIAARKKCYAVTGCCGGIGLLLFLILLPLSFSKLEFHQIGMLKSRVTGTVNRDKVYPLPGSPPGGNWYLGPGDTFITYPSNVTTVSEFNIAAWTKKTATDSGTSVDIDVTYQYKLIPEYLPQLFDIAGESGFRAIIENEAIQAIKETATSNYTSDDFLQNRQGIEEGFFEAMKPALRQVYARPVSLQLRRVDFTREFVDKKLKLAIKLLQTQKSGFERDATRIRQETKFEATQITNRALRIEDEAKALAKLHVERANNTAIELRQNARTSGIKGVRDALGLTQQKHFISLDYLITLADTKGFRTFIDFNTVLAKGGT